MKIALVCEHGGHLTEMLQLMEVFEQEVCDIFFISIKSLRTSKLPYNKYLLDSIGINPFRMFMAFLIIFKILYVERPNVVISTGAEIAIPAFYISKIFGIKTIFIESFCRVSEPSVTSKIVYPVSDVFLVQWKQLLSKFGNKAQYWGSVL